MIERRGRIHGGAWRQRLFLIAHVFINFRNFRSGRQSVIVAAAAAHFLTFGSVAPPDTRVYAALSRLIGADFLLSCNELCKKSQLGRFRNVVGMFL